MSDNDVEGVLDKVMALFRWVQGRPLLGWVWGHVAAWVGVGLWGLVLCL